MRRLLLLTALALLCATAWAKDHHGITTATTSADRFTLIEGHRPTPLLIDEGELKGVRIAAENLCADFDHVCGQKPVLHTAAPAARRLIIVGTQQSPLVRQMVKAKRLDTGALRGKTEMYLMTTVERPLPDVDEALVIVGSDMRGTIYGIYELSEQIGVSPWYDWMDVPVAPQSDLSMERGTYTAGEPAVRYRGLFLNDEAPCLTSWVKHTYGTDYGDHRFYGRVFELILRLRGNFLWPAMWMWSFYADDPLNSPTASEMGVIMGTSHHEPMARNHQEWARHRSEYGAWDYTTNREVIDRFFREGMRRSRDNEDLITIGMRGDGDTAMGGTEGKDDELTDNDIAVMKVLEQVMANQRKIIAQETGRRAADRQQVWALYKEVQRYYDKGLRVPDDVILLLSDDNWGDIRRLPTEAERKQHKGGFGMYYHVDYVGAPRNSKWLNVSPIQHVWDQLTLTYQHGVDRLWVLNVGDLKPMEYPITLFMDMAWDPTRYDASNLLDHPRAFCAQQLGEEQADEAARLLNLYCQYAGRVTPEMLDAKTYDVRTGEWATVCAEMVQLEAEALRQYATLPAAARDAYQQLLLFPIQALTNLYQMYYAQAMNHKLYAEGNPEANLWADRTEAAFRRDAELCRAYNKDIAGGKWDGMMTQKHIGYTSWNDDFPADRLPEVRRFDHPEAMAGGYTFRPTRGYVAMDAEHYYSAEAAPGTAWTVIPHMGRTRSAMALQPYTAATTGSHIAYRMQVPEGTTEAKVHVITAATLAWQRAEGHRYSVGFEGQEAETVNFNGELTEDPANVYRITYPTVARRVIEKVVTLKVAGPGPQTLVISPLDPGVVIEKVVVDFGGYQPTYLFGQESDCSRPADK